MSKILTLEQFVNLKILLHFHFSRQYHFQLLESRLRFQTVKNFKQKNVAKAMKKCWKETKKRSWSWSKVRVWYFEVTSRSNPRFPCVTKTFVTIVWVGAFGPLDQSTRGTRGTIMKEGERKQNNISTPFHWECVCVFVREVTVRDWN